MRTIFEIFEIVVQKNRIGVVIEKALFGDDIVYNVDFDGNTELHTAKSLDKFDKNLVVFPTYNVGDVVVNEKGETGIIIFYSLRKEDDTIVYDVSFHSLDDRRHHNMLLTKNDIDKMRGE